MSRGEAPGDPPGRAPTGTLSLDEPAHDATRLIRARPTPTPLPAPRVLATQDPSSYEFGAELGRGGLGRVVSATDRRLDRPIAIKELITLRGDLERRFVREAMITARLQHPGIVPVYEAGRWPSGEPFYAMRIIAGRSLATALANARTPAERMALLPSVLAATRAVAYAHSQGVIHRDLKPSNIMLGPFGETVVIDWGLARSEHDASEPVTPEPATPDPEATRQGTILGTPHYMAPEQARGEAADARADVHALGAILYTLLAGQHPYGGLDSEAAIAAVATRSATPVERLSPRAPAELVTIVEKAMARERADRYPDAGALGADLERYATGQLVGAHSYDVWQLLGRFLRRHLAAVLVSAVLLTVLAVFAVISIRQILVQRRRAEVAEVAALSERDRAEDRAAQLILIQARASLRTDPTAALAWLEQYPRTAPGWGAAREIAAAAITTGVARHVLAHTHAICCLATLGPQVLAGDAGGTVVRWGIANGSREVLSHRTAPVTHVAARGSTLAWAHGDGAILTQRSDAPAGSARTLRTGGSSVLELLVLPDGDVAAMLSGGGIVIWDGTGASRTLPQGGSRGFAGRGGVAPLDDRVERMTAVGAGLVGLGRGVVTFDLGAGVPAVADQRGTWMTATPDGHRWAMALREGGILVGDATGGTPLALGPGTRFIDLAINPDGRFLLASDPEHGLVRWDLTSLQGTPLGSHLGAVRMALSPDGQRAAAASLGEGTIQTWDVRQPVTTQPQQLMGHGGEITDLSFADDDTLVSAAKDRAVRVWHLGTPPALRLSASSAAIIGLATPADGRWLAIARADGVLTWRDATGAERPLVSPAGRHIAALVADPGGRWLAACDREVVLYDTTTGARRVLAGPGFKRLAVSPDGRVLAGVGGELVRWRLEDPTHPSSVAGPFDQLAFSPDGSWLATATVIGEIDLHGTGAVRRLGSVGGRLALLAAVSATELVTLSEAGDLRLWNVAGGSGRSLGSPEGPIAAAAIAPGHQLIAAAIGSELRLWQLPGGEVRVFTGHTGSIVSLDFSPDGRRLASGDGLDTRVLRIWDLASGEGRVVDGPSSLITRVLFPTSTRVVFGDGGGDLWEARDDLPEDVAALLAQLGTLTSARLGANDLAWSP